MLITAMLVYAQRVTWPIMSLCRPIHDVILLMHRRYKVRLLNNPFNWHRLVFTFKTAWPTYPNKLNDVYRCLGRETPTRWFCRDTPTSGSKFTTCDNNFIVFRYKPICVTDSGTSKYDSSSFATVMRFSRWHLLFSQSRRWLLVYLQPTTWIGGLILANWLLHRPHEHLKQRNAEVITEAGMCPYVRISTATVYVTCNKYNTIFNFLIPAPVMLACQLYLASWLNQNWSNLILKYQWKVL
jgi:hypothetical protein